MIQNQEELTLVRKQLSRIEDALVSLRARLKNERNFAIYSEGYVDQIAELKAEIDAYQKAAKKNGKDKRRRGRKAS
ncbi:MAG: hypothetical protein L0Y72_23270 [Gemmataceae bacterium]|nr:hypothetical protein [Gemmataceae bacterium]MCI0741965.1 hypothetical protein [Gemmataceae bacterium]